MTSHYIKKDVDKMIIGTNSLDRFCVDNNGNVGIGTTNPSSKLEVNGNIYPTTDNSFDLGTTNKQLKDVYIKGNIMLNSINMNTIPTGDMVLLDTTTASGSSNINITDVFTTNYKIYKIIIIGLKSSSSTDNLRILLSSDNGSSYYTTSYDYRHWYNANTSETYSTSVSYLELNGSSLISTYATNLIINIYNMASTNARTILEMEGVCLNSTPQQALLYCNGYRNATATADNAIRFYLQTGNITGKVLTYGLK